MFHTVIDCVCLKTKKLSMHNLSLFSQIVTLLDRSSFKKLVSKHQANKNTKSYDAWSHLITMIFCHFGNCQSLRDISNGLRSATGNLSHLGIRKAPSKSSISYQNIHRSWKLFADFYLSCKKTLGQQAAGWGKKLHLKRPVFLLDSSVVTLTLGLFNWAKYTHEKGAIKLHTLLDYEDRLPSFIHITNGNKPDNTQAYRLPIPMGSIVVADRGYMDFELFNYWDSRGVFFVVRHRKDIKFDSIKEYDLPDEDQHILKDEIIEMCNLETWHKYSYRLRRVVIWDEKRHNTIELLTNNSKLSAHNIAELYRNRWYIETFFKEIKQNLRIKSFIGTSENAVQIQLWTAMITILLLKYLKAKSQYRWHLSNLIVFLRLNLLTKIDLWRWLNCPFDDLSPPQSSLIQGVLF